MLFGGGYYHKVIGNKYNRVKAAYHHPRNVINQNPKITFVSANLDIDYFGYEVGVRFSFSKSC